MVAINELKIQHTHSCGGCGGCPDSFFQKKGCMQIAAGKAISERDERRRLEALGERWSLLSGDCVIFGDSGLGEPGRLL